MTMAESVYVTRTATFLPMPVANDGMEAVLERRVGGLACARVVLRQNGIVSRHYVVDPHRPARVQQCAADCAGRARLCDDGFALNDIRCSFRHLVARQLMPNHA